MYEGGAYKRFGDAAVNRMNAGFDNQAAIQRALLASGDLGLVEKPVEPVGRMDPRRMLPQFAYNPSGGDLGTYQTIGPVENVGRKLQNQEFQMNEDKRDQWKYSFAMDYAKNRSDMFADPEGFDKGFTEGLGLAELLSAIANQQLPTKEGQSSENVNPETPPSIEGPDMGNVDIDAEVQDLMNVPEEDVPGVIDAIREVNPTLADAIYQTYLKVTNKGLSVGADLYNNRDQILPMLGRMGQQFASQASSAGRDIMSPVQGFIGRTRSSQQ